MDYDLLHIQGKPYVLVPLHDYREMSGQGSHASDLPNDVLDALASGQDHPVKVLRKHRGYTQKELADIAGISRPYLAEIETSKKDGSISAYKALAGALEVPLETLIS
jgi:DNA-binding XRE family transcriptional regulator